METVKAMLHDQDLSSHLWAEAVVYVQNRMPHQALDSGRNDFGYPVYIHVPKEKRTKLKPSGKKGIFVSYSRIQEAIQDAEKYGAAYGSSKEKTSTIL